MKTKKKATNTAKARLDADRTAKPKTRLVKRGPANQVVAPHLPATHIEDEDGTKTPIHERFAAATTGRTTASQPNLTSYDIGLQFGFALAMALVEMCNFARRAEAGRERKMWDEKYEASMKDLWGKP